MMLRVQSERMNAAFFPTEREYARRYGLDGDRMARLPEHAIVMHPGPMNRGMEITAEVADSPRCTAVEQVANGVSIRMAVLYLLLGGNEPAIPPAPAPPPHRGEQVTMSKILIRGAKILGGEPQDVLIDGETIAEVGTGLTAEGAARGRGRRPDPAARPGRPAHPPARARPRGLRDGADRHPRRGRRRLHRGARDGQHLPGRRHRRRRRAGLAARQGVRLLRRAAGRRRHRRPGGQATRRTRRDGRLRRRRAGLLRRRQVRGRRGDHAPRAGVREGVRRRRRPARPGAPAHRGRPDERGHRLRRAGPDRLARGRRGVDHRPRRAARRARRLPGAHLPPVHRRLGRDRALGQVQGLGRHRRGHPAPPAAHRRTGAHATTRSTRSTRRCAPRPT